MQDSVQALHSRHLTYRCTLATSRIFLEWISFMACFLACLGLPVNAGAASLPGTVRVDGVLMTGRTTNTTTFDGGTSRLRWPIDVKTPGLGMNLGLLDCMDLDLSVVAEPWGANNSPMLDCDYLDEAEYAGRQPHAGVDIASTTELDSKALVMAVSSRIFPVRRGALSAGISLGYRHEEYDYRGFNTSQTGYGPWASSSAVVDGPSTLYSVDYDIFSAGIALKSAIEDGIEITFEVLALPYVCASDEDDHLRRNRVTRTSSTGSGYQTSVRGSFTVTDHWVLASECAYARIATDGHQTQYWYGDDPATPGFNDTGYSLSGIDAELDLKTFRVAIGLERRF